MLFEIRLRRPLLIWRNGRCVLLLWNFRWKVFETVPLDQNRTGGLQKSHGFLETVDSVSVLLKAPSHLSPERAAEYCDVLE